MKVCKIIVGRKFATKTYIFHNYEYIIRRNLISEKRYFNGKENRSPKLSFQDMTKWTNKEQNRQPEDVGQSCVGINNRRNIIAR